MSHLTLFLLGPPRIERAGEPVEIRRRKAMALIVYLAVIGQSHSRDALATLLWPELDQSRARAGLRRALTALRKGVGESFLDVDRETVGLNRDADIWLDVDEFQERLAKCQAHGHPEDKACPACLPLLAEAAVLYRDDFLTGFTLPGCRVFDEWQFFQSEGLRNELASALERLARGHSGRDEFEQAITYARRWLALDPLHEPAHRCLMQLYAWSGQRATALRQYGECERVLREELGVSPEEETIQVYEAIEENRKLPRPVVLPRAVRRHNLPIQSTPFVGREAALAEIKDRLQDPDCRLLTLVGPGGSGKTRLALEAAAALIRSPLRRLRSASQGELSLAGKTTPDLGSITEPSLGLSFDDGVLFVSLAPLQSVEAIVPSIAQAIDLPFYTDAGRSVETEPWQQLLGYLGQKSLLLILDNFEHLLTCPEPGRRDGAGLVTEILKTAPNVKILATSRARLNVQGEHLFSVTGMDYPELLAEETTDAARYSAIELFLASARRVEPGFALTDDNLADVVHICRLVEGMPLGILLAAAWVGMLTPAEIAAEISGEISQGLDFLETDLRDVPERQRSMRAVFDHSWSLLTMRERGVMQALSVFRGGFTREAAQHITRGSLRELKALADRSLLRRTSAGRYEAYHELLRQYAQERLEASGTANRVRQRHSEYYLNVLHQRRADLLLRGRRPLTPLPAASGEQAVVATPPVSASSQPLIDPLTRRELEVLQLIAAGLSNQEIAEQLVVAVSTVKKHINRIYSKLGVKRRTQAVIRARELNLL